MAMFDSSLGYHKKRATVFWSFLVVAFLASGFLVWQVVHSDNLSTKDSEASSMSSSSSVTVVYEVQGGGRIEGQTTQTVPKWGKTTSVTAIPNNGYYFSSWSDGNTNPERRDQVIENTIYRAIFKKEIDKE